jgi:hypothetical protein
VVNEGIAEIIAQGPVDTRTGIFEQVIVDDNHPFTAAGLQPVKLFLPPPQPVNSLI